MAEEIPLEIVYEDDDLAVVNKAAGMMVHAGAGATEDERNRGTLANALLQTEQGVQLVMDPKQAQNLLTRISRGIEEHPEIAGQPILLTSASARRHLYKLTSRFIPQLIVLSHNEISADAQVQSVGLVEMMNHAS